MGSGTRNALALAAGFGTGYLNADRQAKLDEERKAEQDWKTEERNRLRQSWTLEDGKRNALTEAYRPRTSADGVVTDGMKGDETVVVNPVDTEALNAPQAQNARAAQALRATGDPMAAMTLETAARQNELGGVQLDAAKAQAEAQKLEAARKEFSVGMVRSFRTGGPETLMKFLSDSEADNKGGAMKFSHTVGPDGAVQVMVDRGDGKIVPIGQKFANDENGWNAAMFQLQRGLDANALYAHQSAIAKSALEERKVAATEKKADASETSARAAEKRAEDAGRRMETLIKNTDPSGKPVTLSDGQVLMKPVRQKDGSIKYEKVAEGNPKAAADKTVANNTALMNNLAASGIGAIDPITQKFAPNEMTAKAADRVTQYLEAGETLNSAKAKTTAEMKKAGLIK